MKKGKREYRCITCDNKLKHTGKYCDPLCKHIGDIIFYFNLDRAEATLLITSVRTAIKNAILNHFGTEKA